MTSSSITGAHDGKVASREGPGPPPARTNVRVRLLIAGNRLHGCLQLAIEARGCSSQSDLHGKGLLAQNVAYEGVHEAIVSPTLFTRVQEVFKTHDKAGERVRKHPHYLRGSLYCGSCGSRMTSAYERGRGGYLPLLFLSWQTQRTKRLQGTLRACREDRTRSR